MAGFGGLAHQILFLPCHASAEGRGDPCYAPCLRPPPAASGVLGPAPLSSECKNMQTATCDAPFARSAVGHATMTNGWPRCAQLSVSGCRSGCQHAPTSRRSIADYMGRTFTDQDVPETGAPVHVVAFVAIGLLPPMGPPAYNSSTCRVGTRVLAACATLTWDDA